MTSSLKIESPVLGQEGETCAECGSQLGADQRYCLNCGRRRAGPRVPYEQHLRTEIPPGKAAAGALEAAPVAKRELSPLMTAAIVTALGVMLLIGVLIGKGDSPQQASAPPAVVKVDQSGTGGETASAEPSASAKSKKASKAGAKGSGVPGKEVDSLTSSGAKSGETVTASKEALESLDNTTGQSYQDSIDKLPDKIATPGKPAEQDPGGQAGGGSGAQVIK